MIISIDSNLGPILETTFEDNAEANFPEFSNPIPLFIPKRNAPEKASPAPTVSIASVFTESIFIFSLELTIKDPLSPLVITTSLENCNRKLEDSFKEGFSEKAFASSSLQNKRSILYFNIDSSLSLKNLPYSNLKKLKQF